MKGSRSVYTDWAARLAFFSLSFTATIAFAKENTQPSSTRGQQTVLNYEEFQLKDLDTNSTSIYLGNTKSHYLHPFLVRQQLAQMIAEKPKDTLHMVALSTRGIGPQLIDVMNEKKYVEKEQGKLAVVVSREDYENNEELKSLAEKADYVILTSPDQKVSEVVADAAMRFAEDQSRAVNVEVFEGGNIARETLFHIVTRSRFTPAQLPVEINCRMNYNSRDIREEAGGLAATEFLGLIKRIQNSLKNIDVHAFLHKEPGVFRGIYEDPTTSFGDEKQIETDSLRVSERTKRMKAGLAHRQNEVGVEMGHAAKVYMLLDEENLSLILVPSEWLMDNIRKGHFRMSVTINGKTAFGDMNSWTELNMDMFTEPVLQFTGKLINFDLPPENKKPVEVRLKLEPRHAGSGPGAKAYFSSELLVTESGEQVAAFQYTYYEFLKSQLATLEWHFSRLSSAQDTSLLKPFHDETSPSYADHETAVKQYAALIEEVRAELSQIEEDNLLHLGVTLCEKVFF